MGDVEEGGEALRSMMFASLCSCCAPLYSEVGVNVLRRVSGLAWLVWRCGGRGYSVEEGEGEERRSTWRDVHGTQDRGAGRGALVAAGAREGAEGGLGRRGASLWIQLPWGAPLNCDDGAAALEWGTARSVEGVRGEWFSGRRRSIDTIQCAKIAGGEALRERRALEWSGGSRRGRRRGSVEEPRVGGPRIPEQRGERFGRTAAGQARAQVPGGGKCAGIRAAPDELEADAGVDCGRRERLLGSSALVGRVWIRVSEHGRSWMRAAEDELTSGCRWMVYVGAGCDRGELELEQERAGCDASGVCAAYGVDGGSWAFDASVYSSLESLFRRFFPLFPSLRAASVAALRRRVPTDAAGFFTWRFFIAAGGGILRCFRVCGSGVVRAHRGVGSAVENDAVGDDVRRGSRASASCCYVYFLGS
ncbi:hypothetical protein DFH09DRAFT_1091848 [Mycena vulgaris]|nr:hypothetical protein DFH09DRAFT_1091848 [Mycena vulgaris]